MPPAAANALWLTAGVSLALAHGLLVAPRLPEPPDGPGMGKLPYARLITPKRVLGLVVMTAAAQTCLTAAPVEQRPLWLVYGSAVTALTWVDACTTWLPSRLSQLVTVESVAAAAVCALTADSTRLLMAHLVGGAVASLILFAVVWRVGRGALGFGDVRLAPLAGALSGIFGVTGWCVSLLASTSAGAVGALLAEHGRITPAPGTMHGFAYGPALWAGPYISLLWSVIRT